MKSSTLWFPVLLLVAVVTLACGCLEHVEQFTGASSGAHGGGGAQGASTSSAGGHGGVAGSTGTGGSDCGDGAVDPGEDCDGASLAGATCATLGYDKGSLACAGDCHFDTSGCCKNECAGPPGDHECASATSVHTCGQYDSDACLEWGNTQQCPGNCDQGQCVCSSDADCMMQQDQCHDSQGMCVAGKCTYPEKPTGTSCDDGDKCTQTDTCQGGTCVGENPVACTALDQCHVAGVCSVATGQCSTPNATNGSACDDGNACTKVDTCHSGTCVGAGMVNCMALDQCHVPGTCDTQSGQCSNPAAANGAACDDNNACTQTDKCQNGMCAGGTVVMCSAQDQCHVVGACDPMTGQCSNPIAGNGVACNDNNACTQFDSCQNGTCVGTNPVVCSAQDPCHVAGSCNSATGQCSSPIAVNGTMCNDNNACTQTDTCQNGTCVGGSPIVCNAPPNAQCYNQAGACNGGQCSYTPKSYGTSCSDSNVCTLNDICDGSGNCGGTMLVCNSPPSQCHNSSGQCSGGSCSYNYKANGSPCNDNNPCTLSDICNGNGTCTGTPMSCTTPPNYQCYNQAGACSGGACGYTPMPFGTSCNDNNACTQNDVCDGGGTCSGTTIQCNSPPGECWNSSGSCGGGSCQYSQKATGTSCSAGVCQSGSCVACLNGQVQSASCNLASWCPPGNKSHTCSNGQWGQYSQCAASTSQRYCGDGSKACGAVICVQLQATCSSTTATATISKTDGTKFLNNSTVTIYSPSTGQSVQYGCLSTANQYSINVSFNPSQLGLNSLDTMMLVNAQLFSPCVGGANYISGDGTVSQCSN